MKHVLTVCIGNICRSPMAQGLLAQALPGATVASAGLGALVGQGADPLALELMQARGIDISAHRAQQISTALCNQADIILVMDEEQRRYIEKQYPQARGKVFRLAEQAKLDVPDPYRQPQDAFEHALSLIDQGVGHWAGLIKKL